jgi:hypothetical protein
MVIGESRGVRMSLAMGDKHSGVISTWRGSFSAVDISRRELFAATYPSQGGGLRSRALGGREGRFVDAGTNGWKGLVAGNCKIERKAIPQAVSFLAGSLPARGGPFERI